MSETPKKTFGKYEAISHLGSGAMGVVWRAQDPVLGRTVAIKTISAALGSDNENKERFLREARAAAQLNHPNIITVFDFGQADNELYMAMELLEGKDLKELITGGQLTFDQKLDIMEQVSDGLAYAHGREVVHRDLKPGNIHVQPNGQVKILDFGLARLGSSDLTKTGVVMGTPNYMSPEQVMGERVDARSDVFSAGAVFYELLTNRKPFDAESVHATLYQVVHRDPPPPRQWDPRLPDEVVTIIETAMSKQVDGRFKNAAAMRDAIRAFRYGEDPEVVEFEETAEPVEAANSDATSITSSPPLASNTGTQKAGGTFKSFGRSPSGSVPPSAGISATPYTTRNARIGAKSQKAGDASASASIPPPPPKSTNPLIIAVVVGVVLIVAVLGYGIVSRDKPADNSMIVSMQNMLVETKLDLARRDLDDKNYKRTIDQAAGILTLSPNNPEALAIREQAQSALREIETSVKAAREAVARGDSAQATAALERVMARDPKNPVIAELSSGLNANFAARATQAKSEMDKAKVQAQTVAGAADDPAYAEAEKLAVTAAQNLKDRQFTAATQTYVQARDAYERARRAIELKQREAERAARANQPVPVATPVPVVATPTPTPTPAPLPTASLRPIPVETPVPAKPAPTLAPTAAPVQTPPPPVTPVGPVPEAREFTTGRTRITPAATAATGKQPKGFDTSGMAIQEFTGNFEFEVVPSPLLPGQPFKVRMYLRNTGKSDAKLDTLTAKILRNGEVTSPTFRIAEDNVKVSQRPMVAEVPGTWVAGTTMWVMDVEAMSKKGERFRCSLTMKP